VKNKVAVLVAGASLFLAGWLWWYQMKKTRALDGTQSASWDAIEATWSYHPDNGFDIILEEKTP
jgi:hypothetical protein